MKTFKTIGDEAHQALAHIGAQAITAVERIGRALGERIAEDQRTAAEQRRRLFVENQQALRTIEAQTLARVRQLAADHARLN